MDLITLVYQYQYQDFHDRKEEPKHRDLKKASAYDV